MGDCYYGQAAGKLQRVFHVYGRYSGIIISYCYILWHRDEDFARGEELYYHNNIEIIYYTRTHLRSKEHLCVTDEKGLNDHSSQWMGKQPSGSRRFEVVRQGRLGTEKTMAKSETALTVGPAIRVWKRLRTRAAASARETKNELRKNYTADCRAREKEISLPSSRSFSNFFSLFSLLC